MTGGGPYLDARAAAKYVGLTPSETLPLRLDPVMRKFYEWARRAEGRGRLQRYRRGVQRGLLFRVEELDAAVQPRLSPAASERLQSMGALARRLAAGERAPSTIPFPIRGGK